MLLHMMQTRHGQSAANEARAAKSVVAVLMLLVLGWTICAGGAEDATVSFPDLPDSDIVTAYEQAATRNVLAAVNPSVFPGYWSVCADGQGFGFGNSYPSLDGHQMADALLWLGQVDTVRRNWAYVQTFQRPDGLLPLAILPSMAGKAVGDGVAMATVDANGGLYQHWVPGNPLAALAGPTYIQNADILFRYTQDNDWLAVQLPSINLTADCLKSLVTEEGRVRGGGYYVEFPARIESDGVAQCYAVDAFRRVAALNRCAGDETAAQEYETIANRIRENFVTTFWAGDHFAEYWHRERGFIASHGLTDADWAAVATGVATPEQQSILWPRLREENGFYYGGMPTGITSMPESYEPWEFTRPSRHDLAAMGRVWYLEAWARARMGDSDGLVDTLRRVSRVGRENGYYWRERYHPDGKGGVLPAGPNTYCEYPANFIRIVQRFLLGVEFRLDGALVLAPTVPAAFWEKGFGQTVSRRDRTLSYRFERRRVSGTYTGNGPQRLGVRPDKSCNASGTHASLDGQPIDAAREEDLTFIELPATAPASSIRFEIAFP